MYRITIKFSGFDNAGKVWAYFNNPINESLNIPFSGYWKHDIFTSRIIGESVEYLNFAAASGTFLEVLSYDFNSYEILGIFHNAEEVEERFYNSKDKLFWVSTNLVDRAKIKALVNTRYGCGLGGQSPHLRTPVIIVRGVSVSDFIPNSLIEKDCSIRIPRIPLSSW